MRLALPLAIAAVLASLFLYTRLLETERTLARIESERAEVDEEEEFELAVSMGRIQRFHQKLWAAGEMGNAELAAFYLHELEESMEEVVEAELVDEGVNVSEKMAVYGLKVVEELEHKLRDEGVMAMHAEATLLVKTCNSCHTECGYPFIRIKVPEAVHFTDQEFNAVENDVIVVP